MRAQCSELPATDPGYCSATAVCQAFASYTTPEPVTTMQGMRWVNKLDVASMEGGGIAEDPAAWATPYGKKYGPDIAVFMIVPAIIAVLAMLFLAIFCFGRVCKCCKKDGEDEEEEILDSMPTCFSDRVVPIVIYGVTVAAVAVPVILGLYAIPVLTIGFTQSAGEAGCLLDDAIGWTQSIAGPINNLTAFANTTIRTARASIATSGSLTGDLDAIVDDLAAMSANVTAVCGPVAGSGVATLAASLTGLSTGIETTSRPTIAMLSATFDDVNLKTQVLEATLGMASQIAGSTLDLVSGFLEKLKTKKDETMGYMEFVSTWNMVAGIVAYSITLLFLVTVPLLAFCLCLAKREALCLRCCLKTSMEVGMGSACILVGLVLGLVVLLSPWSLVFSDVCVVVDDASNDWNRYINGSFAQGLPISPVDALQSCFDQTSVLGAVGIESKLDMLNQLNFSGAVAVDVSSSFDFSALATLSTTVAGYTIANLGWDGTALSSAISALNTETGSTYTEALGSCGGVADGGATTCAPDASHGGPTSALSTKRTLVINLIANKTCVSETLVRTQTGLAALVGKGSAITVAATSLQTSLSAVDSSLAPTRELGKNIKKAGNCGFVRLRFNAMLTWMCGDALRAIILLALSFLLLGLALMLVFMSIFSLLLSCKKHRYEDSSTVAPAHYGDQFGGLTDTEAAVIKLQAIARGSNARKLDVPPSLQNHLIQCFAEVDVDGSGTLDSEEFWRLVAKAQPLLTSTQIDRLRKRVDVDNNGVDWNEFVDIAPEIFKEFYSELYAEEAAAGGGKDQEGKRRDGVSASSDGGGLKGGGWIVCAGAGGKPYYYNARTGERSWTKPAELVALDGDAGFTEGSVKTDGNIADAVAASSDDPPPAAPAAAVAAKKKATEEKVKEAKKTTTTKVEGKSHVERTASSSIILPPQLKEYLAQLFAAADTDKSGELDKAEVRAWRGRGGGRWSVR